MSEPSVSAVKRLPNPVASVGRIKRSYLLDTRAAGAIASNDPSYPRQDAHELAAWARRAVLSSGFGEAPTNSMPSADSLARDAAARAKVRTGLAAMVAELAQAAAAAVRRALDAWRRQRDRHATERALRALDGRTLRDLGFDPSEVHSVAMELSGDAEPTRVQALMRLRFMQI
jgi:uncharacterized protein YjiS (DUF1127 family)